MKKLREPVLLFILLVLMALPNILQDKPSDWSDDFEKDSKHPYGSITVFKSLEDLFPKQPIKVNNLPLTYLYSDTLTGHNLIFVTGRSNTLDYIDLGKALVLAEQGNQVWISSTAFETSFLDSLNVQVQYPSNWRTDDKEVFLIEANQEERITAPSRGEYHFFSAYPEEAEIMATRYPDKATLLKLDVGLGALWLHTCPKQLSNITLLETPRLIESQLTLLPNQPTIWDAYYKPKRRTSGDFLSFVRSQPSLLIALYLSVGLVILSFIFFSKRRQRAVPIIREPENKMKSFTESIAHLMLADRDSRGFIQLKWKHFENDVRRRFQLSTTQHNFKEYLSKQSGWDIDRVDQLFKYYRDLESQHADKASMLKLAHLIDEYYHLTKKEKPQHV